MDWPATCLTALLLLPAVTQRMTIKNPTCWLLVFAVMGSNVLLAELPESIPVEQAIDLAIQHKLDAKAIAPNPLADDSVIIRRTTLDLAGRIPTVEEARNYVASTEPDKRLKLVDRLMSSPDFPYHFRNCLDRMLMDGFTPGEWREYLLRSVRNGRSWDQMFRDMMTGDEANEEVKPALTFLKSRANDIDRLTNDTCSLFFGVNVSCAKCHDHPLVSDWKQDHYYGMASFFNRVYVTKKNVIAEKFRGEVKYKTTKGEEKVAKIMFLTGMAVDEPVVEKTQDQIKQENEEINRQTRDDSAGPPPKPDFSPRWQLVELALRADQNAFFTRNAVNRVWAVLLGRGLVHPLDQMHSGNPASHPELLEWLSHDLLTHQYDLKRLVRGITLSQAYARSSAAASSNPLPDDLFATGPVKPLTPRQYSLSLRLASLNPEMLTSTSAPEWTNRRDELDRAAEDIAGQFEIPGENFQIGVDEALFMTNNAKIWDEFARDENHRLVGALKQKSDDAANIELAYWTIFSRPPTAEERSDCESFLAQHNADPVKGLRQLVWSLLVSPELRFNY